MSIHQKLVAVMKQVQSVEMTGEHYHDYLYHTRNDAFQIRPALCKQGISTQTRIKNYDIQPVGDGDVLTTVEYQIIFTCDDTGEQAKAEGIGQGVDAKDSGASKAQTNAIKNAILNTFLLGDEPGYYGDDDSTSDQSTGSTAGSDVDIDTAVGWLEDVLMASYGLAESEAQKYMTHLANNNGGHDTIRDTPAATVVALSEALQDKLTEEGQDAIDSVMDTIEG